MKLDHVGGKYYHTVTAPDDLQGWEIIYSGKYKPGVYLLHVVERGGLATYMTVMYCPTKLLPWYRWWKFWL